jgi:hypothetical protein
MSAVSEKNRLTPIPTWMSEANRVSTIASPSSPWAGAERGEVRSPVSGSMRIRGSLDRLPQKPVPTWRCPSVEAEGMVR